MQPSQPDVRLARPLLGQDTDAVLGQRLGLDAGALAAPREKGLSEAVVRSGPAPERAGPSPSTA